ncbi:AMP-binding protein [Saccharicrinis aurantiacus]|uniref:AMP-binding protein n=1 Tax=Saccharicrinis aurantiacus TaxID=1849719 RepID=UPI000839AB9E|nr:AMP-binding protein [Saccharicrinis aurantiacus]
MKQHHPIVIKFAQLFSVLVRFILSARYRVSIKNASLLKGRIARVILPNHQAIMDPVILFANLYKYTSAVPVVTSSYYDMPVVKSIFKTWGAVRVSDLESGSRNTKVLDQITDGINKSLDLNNNVVLYPAGQLAGQGYERILNKQSAFKVIGNMPDDAQVLAVRISGLWGSRWSKAWTGKSPNFGSMLLKCLGLLLASLLFFLPRRKVSIEIIDVTKEAKAKSKLDKKAFNEYLESVYNQNGEEQVKYVKYHCLAPKLKKQLPDTIVGSVKFAKQEMVSGKHDIPDEVFKKVQHILHQILEGLTEIKKSDFLQIDLGADSLNIVEIIDAIENEFESFSPPQIIEVKTVSDLCLVAMGQFKTDTDLKPTKLYHNVSEVKRLAINEDQNILQQFIKSFTTHKKDPFCYDAMLGSTDKKTFFLKTCVVSELLKKEVKEQHVGIMLPALQSTTMLIAACYLAGKIPVMLNWTVGKKILQHCIDTAGVKTILSAGAFISKIEEQLPDDLKEKIILLEKKVPELSTITKLKGALKATFPGVFISAKRIPDEAVILFTSGSDALPKAVPLTHRNIVSDLASVFKIINLDNNQSFLSFLPPFHSFGFSVLSILPLLTGAKVAYTPNPTDSREVLRIMKHVKANILVGTPSFLKLLLSEGSAYEFKSVQYAVSGAEAMPESLKLQFEALTQNGIILEGYGITECAPVLTINPQSKQKLNSVGKFLPDVTGLVLDVETHEPLKANEAGMIYAKGPNVFDGYLNQPELKPFEEINGERYYKTGDLGYIDEEGYLFITGRLKRFIKIAGEMISLPFIEKILLQKYGSSDAQVLAVEGSDKVKPARIALFAKNDIDLNEANAYLLQNGVAPIAKLKELIAIDEIPVLGTGKTDYKVLKAILEKDLVN